MLIMPILVFLSANPMPGGSEGGSPPISARESLQPFNGLVGTWKGTGAPEASPEERQKGLWVETIEWAWKFDKGKAWLAADIRNGKHFTAARLEPNLQDPGTLRLTLTSVDGKSLAFVGACKDRVLTAERTDDATGQQQRIVLSLLHENRFLYRYETKSADAFRFSKIYQVGATKQGVPFANVPSYPECIVTGGKASIKVTYQGQEYWVCCSGCKDAFYENPEKILQEAAQAKSKDSQKK